MPDYKYVTDEAWQDGSGGGMALGLRYAFFCTKHEERIEVSMPMPPRGAFWPAPMPIATLTIRDCVWRLEWIPVAISKEVAGDAFVLLTDIAGEIERRIEEAQSVEPAP